jgi:hypothetical protein
MLTYEAETWAWTKTYISKEEHWKKLRRSCERTEIDGEVFIFINCILFVKHNQVGLIYICHTNQVGNNN